MKQLLLSALLAVPFLAQPSVAKDVDTVQVIEDRENLVTKLRIEADADGNVAMSDVFRAVSRYSGFDDAEIKEALPKGRINLHGKTACWSIRVFNRVMRPCVEATREPDALRVEVDRLATQKWMHDCKKDFRWAWSKFDWRSERPEYGLQMISASAEQNPANTNDSADLVVLIHGLNSYPDDLMGLVSVAQAASHDVASLRYPNDQPVMDSALLLANELHRISIRSPNRKVRLLTHSMGGLVARAVVESDLDPGNVSQLIMIAPPNQGSSLAGVASFMDCYEFCVSANQRRLGALVEFVSDGLGEATADITPGSVLLDRLNRYDRNPNVSYSILVGTGGPMDEQELDELRQTVRDYTDNYRITRFFSSKLNRALNDLDEVVAGKGDGAVSCERASLEGVSDVLEFPFSHASILNPRAEHSSAAHAVIRARLENRWSNH